MASFLRFSKMKRGITNMITTVDVVIPTYKPDKSFLKLIDMLANQSYTINRIIIVNTEEKYFSQLVYGTNFGKKYQNVEVYHHSKREFDHGRTRATAAKRSKADIFVCMTQDAVPKDQFLIEELVKGLEQEGVAVSYARQLPNENCGVVERFTRRFNYPEEAMIKGEKDLPILGIKTYFCSNVCAAYNKDIYEKNGGFIKHTIFNEDMIFAAGIVKAGYQIAYVPSAMVIHSHNYSNKEQFQRNFDLGVSQADHPEIFANVPSGSEGKKLVGLTKTYLKENGYKKLVLSLYVKSGFKLCGYVLGKNYKKIPKAMVVKCSMNKAYWNRNQMINASSKINPASGYGNVD